MRAASYAIREPMTQDPSDPEIQARRILASRALERFATANGSWPMSRSMLFPAESAIDRDQNRQVRDHSWQFSFLEMLVEKNVLEKSLKNFVPCYSIRNRYFVTSILEDLADDGNRLDILIQGNVPSVLVQAKPPVPEPAISVNESMTLSSDRHPLKTPENDPSLEAAEEEPVEVREHSDPWYDSIVAYVSDRQSTTTSDILAEALGIDESDQNNGLKRRVGGILREIGWIKSLSAGPRPVRIWIKEPIINSIPEMVESQPTEESDVVKILKSMNEAMINFADLQTKLAENIIFIRDRGEEMHDKINALTKRMKNLEENRPDSVQSQSSVTQEVEDAVRVVAKQLDSDRIARIELLTSQLHGLRADLTTLMEGDEDE